MPPNQQNPYNQTPQQNSNGGYDVVPPLPNTANGGHTGHNPYEFIVNPAQQQRKSLFGTGKNRMAMQLLAIVGIAVIVIIVVVVVFSMFAPKGPTAGLTAIAERQQEIIRIASGATNQATSQDTKNFVANVNVVINSNQSQVLTYLTSHNVKLKDKDLALDKSDQTDTQLANALTINTYDSVVTQNLVDQINTYRGLLQSTYKDTGNAALKQILQTSFSDTNLLLEQAKASPTTN